jgi:hypothetical protein
MSGCWWDLSSAKHKRPRCRGMSARRP